MEERNIQPKKYVHCLTLSFRILQNNSDLAQSQQIRSKLSSNFTNSYPGFSETTTQ